MLRNIFVWVLFDVDYPLKADSPLDTALLRVSNFSLKRQLEGVTNSHLFVFCGNTSLEQASEIISKYQFAERHVTTIAGPEVDECGLEPFDFGDSIDRLVGHWLHDYHPGALTNINSASEVGLDVWWSGVEAETSEFDYSSDLATTLPDSHQSKINTWLVILRKVFPFAEGDLQEEQEFLVAVANFCKWLHGFEEASGNEDDAFDYSAVVDALPFEDFYLGFLLGQCRGLSEFYEVMEESDSESTFDLKTYALQQAIQDEGAVVRNALLDFFGGNTGLFWTLYSAGRQNYSRPAAEQCNERLNYLLYDDLVELIDPWEYVAGSCTPILLELNNVAEPEMRLLDQSERLTRYHESQNEQCLKESTNQRHVSQQEAIEQTHRLMKQSEDSLYESVIKAGPFPGMTVVQSMVEIKRLVHDGSLQPGFKFMFYSEDAAGNVLIREV